MIYIYIYIYIMHMQNMRNLMNIHNPCEKYKPYGVHMQNVKPICTTIAQKVPRQVMHL